MVLPWFRYGLPWFRYGLPWFRYGLLWFAHGLLWFRYGLPWLRYGLPWFRYGLPLLDRGLSLNVWDVNSIANASRGARTGLRPASTAHCVVLPGSRSLLKRAVAVVPMGTVPAGSVYRLSWYRNRSGVLGCRTTAVSASLRSRKAPCWPGSLLGLYRRL